VEIHSDGITQFYGHMFRSGVLVRAGESVAAGQEIALVGDGGNSIGYHLYFGLIPDGYAEDTTKINPAIFMAQQGAPLV
jgi:murein DD-endopeptidase MepM/ murein hydrolase activator NlpD